LFENLCVKKEFQYISNITWYLRYKIYWCP